VAELALMGRYPHRPHGFFESARDHEIARQAMEATGVLGLAGQAVEALSGGERQRAVLARALAQEPRLLILDEPTAHLDLRYQVETAELLRRLNRDCGVTIILVSHDLNLAAELSDRLLLISEGRVRMIGAPERVIDEEVLESVYGCPVRVGRNPESGRPNVQLIWREKPEEVIHDD
jgi:iron complex transport system ATP-binding protein